MVTTNTPEDLHCHNSGHNGPIEMEPPFILTTNTGKNNTTHPILLHNQGMIHHPKAGLNPLVDAAAPLFSFIGKIKNIKSYRNLVNLQNDLVTEINTFQDAAYAQGYSSEYILVSRYALCATIDDIISYTPWGKNGEWNNYSLLALFSQEPIQQDRFFLILERLIKDPTNYIDVMELMYLCLSLGYKGCYSAEEFNNNELEKITHALYKRIRAYRGDFSKMLSPFPIKTPPLTKKNAPKISYWFTFFITASIIMLVFIGLTFLLENISNQAYQELMHIGKSILYESNNPI